MTNGNHDHYDELPHGKGHRAGREKEQVVDKYMCYTTLAAALLLISSIRTPVPSDGPGRLLLPGGSTGVEFIKAQIGRAHV